MAGVVDTTLGNALPLGYGLVRGTGLKVVDHTGVAAAPAPEHFYNALDTLSDGTNLQVCTQAGESGSSLPSSWNHAPGGVTTWGGSQFTNYGTTNGSGWQYGLWVLGEGEWDGFSTIWNQVSPIWAIGYAYDIASGSYNPGGAPNPPAIHFHSGTDGAFGLSLPMPSSNGPDQGCDNWIGEIPPGDALVPQTYSRMAYYMMKWLPMFYQGTDYGPPYGSLQVNQAGQVMSPIGDWRALRCRIFDDLGNQTGYQWTTNPAWHWVDAILRCCMFPRSEYQINMALVGGSYVTTPQALPSDVVDKFDWGSIYEFSQDCDYVLANGRKRYEGNYLFASQTPLAAILEQIMSNSRSYMQEYAGRLFIQMDKPRATTFVLTDKEYLPGSLKADQKEAKQNADDYTCQFLDILLPAVWQIESIDFIIPGPGPYTSGQATVVTVQEHGVAPEDVIESGGCDVIELNRGWLVNNIIDDYTFTCQPTNATLTMGYSDTPSAAYIGYPQARFTKRAPKLWHLQHSIARGQIGT